MPAFWPGESHGQRSLAGYRPGGCKESDVAEWLGTQQVVDQGLQHSLPTVCEPHVAPEQKLGTTAFQRRKFRL